jgi:hypothetical protein
MDHIYPYPKWGSIKKGTPCYCGQQKWGIEKKKEVK